MFEEQYFFGEELDTIKNIYIKTSFGNIFTQAVGKPGQPLIIVVHGSGPKNSSDQYLFLLHEYLVRVSYLEKYFIIAIDCPGYGRSKGSKQAVKTFPLKMFEEILHDLNYSSYYAMFGHSQGGAAIFHAVYEKPSITQFLLMDRPVCGNIKRFNKFPIPTLLVYDIEDDGHPLWQGKLLYNELLKSQFHTYRNSQHPYFVPDNIWNLILGFLQLYSSHRKGMMNRTFHQNRNANYHSQTPKKRGKSGKVKKQKYIASVDKCEQIKKQKKAMEQEMKQIKQIDKSQLYSMLADVEELEDLPLQFNQPKIQMTVEEENQYTSQMKKKKQSHQKQTQILENKVQSNQKLNQGNQKKQDSLIKNQKSLKTDSIKKQKQENIVKKEDKKEERKDKEEENCCSICYDSIFYPVQTNCKHIFCKKCIGESYLVNQKCPLCRTEITKRTFKQELHNKIICEMKKSAVDKRKNDLNKFEEMLKSIFYVEIGNNSRELPTKQSHFSKTKKKYMWDLYAKEPRNFKFEEVLFNINMGEATSKPIRLTSAPFVFQSRGTFSFSCQITIKPKNRQYGTITSIYRIQISPGNHSKMIAVRRKIDQK